MHADLPRDHIFVSYASEDWWFVEWLCLKLSMQGYRVWCDKFKLLGGEPYPLDIETALKERTYRQIAVISRNSIAKENPIKEWTKAINLGKERHIPDFVIPVNLDGLRPAEISWLLSDLTYIPFFHGFSQGLDQLLKKLASIEAPQSMPDAKGEVARQLAQDRYHISEGEMLCANCLKVLEIPKSIFQYDLDNPITAAGHRTLSTKWATYRIGNYRLLAFHPPSEEATKEIPTSTVKQWNWKPGSELCGVRCDDVVKYLIERSFGVALSERGLRPMPSRDDCWYFTTHDRIKFTDYEGKATWRNVVGERTLTLTDGSKSKYRWHLSVCFRTRKLGKNYFVQIVPKAYVTDLDEGDLRDSVQKRRMKKVTKEWWNDDMLNYQLLVAEHLSRGSQRIVMGNEAQALTVLSQFPQSPIPVRIDEAAVFRSGKGSTPSPDFESEDSEEVDEVEEEEDGQ